MPRAFIAHVNTHCNKSEKNFVAPSSPPMPDRVRALAAGGSSKTIMSLAFHGASLSPKSMRLTGGPSPPLAFAPAAHPAGRFVLFFFCTILVHIPQDNAAEIFADPRSVRPGAAPCARPAPPLPQECATASSSGRAALIAASGNRDLPEANREAATSEQGTSREFDSTIQGSPPCLFAPRRAGDPSFLSNSGKANEK